MSTAIDTNILVDLLAGDADASGRATHALDEAARQGALVLCPVVYAELLSYPGRSIAEVDGLLAETRLVVDWAMSTSVWRRAGEAFSAYAAQRRAAGDGTPRRLLADFLIGAHAMEAGRLLTRDLGLYRTSFPNLTVVAPA